MLIAVIALLLCGVVLFIWKPFSSYDRVPTGFSTPTLTEQMQQDITNSTRSGGFSADGSLQRMRRLFDKTGMDTPFVASWYMPEGSIKAQWAKQSHIYLCEDQILMILCYIEAGDAGAAKHLLDATLTSFTDPEGGMYSYRTAKDLDIYPEAESDETLERIPQQPSSVGYGLLYLDAYLRYYEKWGSAGDWDTITRISASICPPGTIIRESIDFQQLVESSTIINTGEEPSDPQPSYFKGTPLSLLSIETLRVLTAVDAAYEADYQRAQEILNGAEISSTVPLYALSYDDNSDTYLYYQGNLPSFRITDTLAVVRSVATENKVQENTLRWLKERLYSGTGMTESYDLVTGASTSSDESLAAYGILMQIAQYISDDSLFSLCAEALMRNTATSSDSEIYRLIYSTTPDKRILLRSKDNAEMILALR